MMNFTIPNRNQLAEFGYARKDNTVGLYVGTVESVTETQVLVKLHEVYDTLKSGERKQSYRTLEISRITTVVERMTLTVG